MGGVIILRSPILFFGVFMKNYFKLIIYIIPLFFCLTFCFPCFASDSGFAWGSDVLTGSNGSANINSLLGDTYSFESLYSPSFVIGVGMQVRSK